MTTKDMLRTRYKQAGLLYVMKEFEDALDILDELLAYVPNSRELLAAKAKCLSAMGFREEAREICQRLVSASSRKQSTDAENEREYAAAQ